MTHLYIHLLGAFQVTVDGHLVEPSSWRLRTAGLLVKALALAPSVRMHREQAMDLLWSEADPATAASNLRYTLHTARRAFASSGADTAGLLVRERDLLLLGSVELVKTDVALFESAVARAWRTGEVSLFRQAAARYTGHLLPEDRYDAWIDVRRAALRTSYLALLSRLAALEESTGDLAAAIVTLQQVLTLEPLDELTHTSLPRVFARSGDRHRATAQYQRLRNVLDHELATKPDPATQELAEAIRSDHFPVAPVPRLDAALDSTALPTAEPESANNLPAPLTQVIGRDRELAEARQLLAIHRLVTLTGPGGVGKTRLAEEIGRGSLAAFPDGVWFVSLASLRAMDLVPPTIARMLGIKDSGKASPLDALVTHLSAHRALLILDNFEHLLDAAPLVAELLLRCPALRILITSRMRLRLTAEQVFQVPSLDLPPESESRPSEMIGFATMRLFSERAREVDVNFQLTAANAPVVATICRRLDGLPLAIELAAARTDEYTLARLATHLERRLPVLTDGPRDLPDRQQTLWNTIAWSYDLLDPPEQSLLRVASVFVGGWTHEAIQTVSGTSHDVWAGLATLTEHNLVQRIAHPDTAPRFTMLETIREFGSEHLDANREDESLRRRHAVYVLKLVEQAEPELIGPEQIVWFERLETEHENLRAALAWSLEHEPPLTIQIVAASWRFWYGRGYVNEGRRWLRLALARDIGEWPTARAKALDGAGVLSLAYGDKALARIYIAEFLQLVQQLGDPASIARAQFSRGILAAHGGDYAYARDAFTEALPLYRALGDRYWITAALNNLGSIAALQDDDEAADRLYTESLQLARDAGDLLGTMTGQRNLAWLDFKQGRLSDAATRHDECVTIALSLDDPANYATLLSGQAYIALERGEYAESRRLLIEGLSIHRDRGDELACSDGLELLARVAAAEGQPLLAARWFGAAEVIRERFGYEFDRFRASLHDRYVSIGQAQVDNEQWSEAWAAGHAMPWDDVVREVLGKAL